MGGVACHDNAACVGVIAAEREFLVYLACRGEVEVVFRAVAVNDRGIAGDDLAAVLLEYHAAEVDCDLRELGEYFALHVVGHLFSHV